jgi:hypothetical protein
VLIALKRRIDDCIYHDCLIGSQTQHVVKVEEVGEHEYEITLWSGLDENPEQVIRCSTMEMLMRVASMVAPEAYHHLEVGQ